MLGPEMRSTGEVMGIDRSFAAAFAKSQIGAGTAACPDGRAPAFLSVQDSDKAGAVAVAKGLLELGFELVATDGTAHFLTQRGRRRRAGQQGARGAPALRRPHARRRHPPGHQHHRGRRGDQGLVLHPAHRPARGLPYFTTLSAARAAVGAIARAARGHA